MEAAGKASQKKKIWKKKLLFMINSAKMKEILNYEDTLNDLNADIKESFVNIYIVFLKYK